MSVFSKRGVGFRAGIAEFLLILRLKSHRRMDCASDIPVRATHIILVTCKNWFTDFNEIDDAPRRGVLPTQRCVPL